MRTDLPWDGILSDDNVRVTVNGKRWPVKSVRIQKGMRDGHPAAKGVLNGAWCIEATIDWAQERLVDTQVPQPFTDDTTLLSGEKLSVPRPGDEVTIATGEGSAFFGSGIWFQQVKGVIDKTTGSFADGTASSTVIDRIEELDRNVQYSALLDYMTPILDGSPMRYQGLQSCWYVDRVLRDESQGTLGWSVAPKRTWETLCAVTSPGSIRPPEVGAFHASTDKDGDNTWLWRKDSEGMPWLTNYTADYTLSSDTNDLVLTVNFPWDASTTTGTGRVKVQDASGKGVFLDVRGDTDRIGVNWAGFPTQTIPRNGVTRAALYFHRTSTTSQNAILRLDDGREFTYSTTTGDLPANWRGDRVTVDSDIGVGWWVVEGEKPAANRWACLEYEPTARIRIGDFQWWRASRDQPRDTAANTLGEQLDAECATMWLDELGVMQWAGYGVLEKQPIHQAITSSLTVDDVGWALDRNSAARSVEVNYLEPRIDIGYQGRVSRDLWKSDNIDLGPGEEETVTVTVPDDEDWLGEDVTPTIIKSWGLSYDKYIEHSHFGGTQYRKSASDEAVWAEFLDCTMTKVGLREYEVWYRPWPSMSSSYRVKSAYPPSTTAFVRVGGTPLVMRGRARIKWVERSVKKSTGNTTAQPRLVHDVGWRVQDRAGAMTNFVDWLAGQLKDPPPVITSIVCEHDPRRQIGDHLRIEDPHVTGAWIELLVQEQDIDINPGTLTDTIRGRVTDFGLLSGIGTSQRPSTHTAITPVTDWMREVA